MHEEFFLDLILVAIAGVLVYRLWTVLGQRHGHESRRRWYFGLRQHPAKEELTDKDAQASSSGVADESSGDPALEQILASLPSFDRQLFLQGARSAFKTIVEAFSRGDSATLGTLVSDEVLERFESEISRGHRQPSTPLLVQEITKCELTRAWIKDRQAHLEVTFVSQQLPAGEGISLAKSLERTDIWVFSKPLDSRGPNWLLTETS